MRWNLLLAALAASWGFVAVLVAAVDLDAESLAFARLVLAAVTLAAIALAVRRPQLLRPGANLAALVLLGAAQGVHWLLFFLAVEHGSVALAVLTFYTAPVFIALAAPVVLHERLSRLALGALVLGGAGVALVAADAPGGGGYSAAAVAAGLGSALSYAALVILSKRLLTRRAEPLTVAFWDCFVGALVVAPVLLVAARVLPQGADEWAVVLLLGVVFSGLATLVYALLLRHVRAQTAGILTFLEPVAAVLLAALLLDDPLAVRTLVGGALVVVSGIAVVWLEPTDSATAAVAPVGSGGS